MSQSYATSDVTQDDKLWGLLTYLLSPIVPIIILLMEDKKNRPFLRYHAFVSLVLGVASIVINTLLSFILVGICTTGLYLIYMIYLGVKAYQGEMTVVPVVSNFVKNQNWA